MVTAFSDLVNLTQAAELLGVSRPTVYEMIDRGELHVVAVAGMPYLDKGEVEELARKRSNKEENHDQTA